MVLKPGTQAWRSGNAGPFVAKGVKAGASTKRCSLREDSPRSEAAHTLQIKESTCQCLNQAQRGRRSCASMNCLKQWGGAGFIEALKPCLSSAFMWRNHEVIQNQGEKPEGGGHGVIDSQKLWLDRQLQTDKQAPS